jgi:hypothetical protein
MKHALVLAGALALLSGCAAPLGCGLSPEEASSASELGATVVERAGKPVRVVVRPAGRTVVYESEDGRTWRDSHELTALGEDEIDATGAYRVSCDSVSPDPTDGRSEGPFRLWRTEGLSWAEVGRLPRTATAASD